MITKNKINAVLIDFRVRVDLFVFCRYKKIIAKIYPVKNMVNRKKTQLINTGQTGFTSYFFYRSRRVIMLHIPGLSAAILLW